MKNQVLFLISFLTFCLSYSQSGLQFAPKEDPFSVNENITSSPETASLGQFGDLSASAYNGTANVNVPIYNLNWEGLSIPINLSYNSGGIKVASEASWVGLNWTSSTTFGIHRKIYGQDDFNDRISGEYQGAPKSGYIYNSLNPILSEGDSRARLSLNDILNAHHSFSLNTVEGRQKVHLDTQPDVYTVNVFGQSYTFIFNKKGDSNILTTKVFNNNNAIITYNLTNESFTLIDDNGFTYLFSTKEISTSFDTVQNDGGGSPPGDYLAAIQSIFATYNRNDAGLITFWHLDSVTSPKGRVLDFAYEEGLNLTFPSYSISKDGRDNNLNFTQNEQSNNGATIKAHSVNTTVIENNYLARISGDFGRIDFTLGEREDLSTGHTIEELSQGALAVMITGKGTQIRECHGLITPCESSTDLLPLKLNRIEIKDFTGNTIVDASLSHTYFNAHKLNGDTPERFIRLKLDQVTVNDKIYSFDYITPDALSAKDSFAVDFWGFDNGEVANNGLVPKIGRFITTPIVNNHTNAVQLGQSFVNYAGAKRASNFNYGKRGILNKFTYPTGASMIIEYEPHDLVMEAPAPFQETSNFNDDANYTGPSRLKWTNMIDESLFKPTYQYLKYASDPSYNYFEKELPTIQGDPVTLPLTLGQSFEIDYPSVVNIEGHLQTHTGWEGLSYWGNTPTVVLLNLNTGQETTIFTYADAPTHSGHPQTVNYVSASLSVVPGEYAIVRRSIYLPKGEDYSDYPPTPGVEYHSDQILLFTFETLSDEDLALYVERFEIGGLRVKSLTNQNSNQGFMSKKEYKYEYLEGLPGLLSSGKLMDDLIFYSKATGFYSYNPRSYHDFTLVGHNMLGQNNSAQGSHIGYSNVQEFQVNETGQSLGMIETEFHNEKNGYFTDTINLPYSYDLLQGDGDPYINIFGNNLQWFCSGGFILDNDCAGTTKFTSTYGYAEIKNTVLLGLPLRLNFSYINGNILEQRIFNTDLELVEKIENSYSTLNGNISLDHFASFLNIPLPFQGVNNAEEVVSQYSSSWEEGIWGANHHTYFPYLFPVHHGLVSKISESTTTSFYGNNYVTNESIYSYDASTHFTKEQRVIVNENDQISNKLYYPTDAEVYNNPNIYRLRNENRLSTLVKQEEYKNQEKIFTQLYGFDNSPANTNNITLVNTVASGKGNNSPEIIYYIDRYDTYGNIIQKHQNNGRTTSYLWTYLSQYPTAVIENATYQQVIDTGINLNIINSLDSTVEQKNTELQKIRDGLPNALVTTYTYKALVGISSQTDPQGQIMYYEYDDQNRLEFIKDQNGKVYSKNEYSYKINN